MKPFTQAFSGKRKGKRHDFVPQRAKEPWKPTVSSQELALVASTLQWHTRHGGALQMRTFIDRIYLFLALCWGGTVLDKVFGGYAALQAGGTESLASAG